MTGLAFRDDPGQCVNVKRLTEIKNRHKAAGAGAGPAAPWIWEEWP
jgi:hypothetical protein